VARAATGYGRPPSTTVQCLKRDESGDSCWGRSGEGHSVSFGGVVAQTAWRESNRAMEARRVGVDPKADSGAL
jgi:hypothetical protein